MAFTLKNRIFGYFGVNAKQKDTYKDVNGKGISERYNECLAEEYDEGVQSLIDNFIDNLIVPQTVLSKFLVYLEYMVGQPIYLSDDEALRRKIIWLNNAVTMTKGTIVSHQILYNLLGVTSVVITEVPTGTGFDSDFTFDDVNRRLDSSTGYSFHYVIELTGSATLDADLEAMIIKIAFYLKPIDGVIEGITYNGDEVTLP